MLIDELLDYVEFILSPQRFEETPQIRMSHVSQSVKRGRGGR